MELTIEQALQQGVAAHKEGKLQDAERLYRAILQSQPLHPDANHNLGVIAVSVNKAEAALPLFKTALEANSKIEQFWLSYIDALIKANQIKSAKSAIEKAKKKGFDANKLQALLSQSKKVSDNIAPSQKLLNSLLELYQEGRYGDTKNLAASITQEFPKSQLAWKVLGAVLAKTDRNSEAANANQTAIVLSPEDPEAHSNLGNTLRELGRLEESEASCRQAVVLKPDFAEAHNNLGNTLKELGKLKDAEASYTQAIELKPDYIDAIRNRWLLLFNQKQYEAALRDADLCISNGANQLDLTSLYALGRIEEIYKRIEGRAKIDGENISIAAFASFVAESEKKHTTYNFCPNPIDFIHISNLSFHLKDSMPYITALIEELDKVKTSWEPAGKTTKTGFQTLNGINLFQTPSGKIAQLKSIVINELDIYYQKFHNEMCSYIQKWPSISNLKGWHVVLKKQGFQSPHIHPRGWLSGVIYLKVVPSLGKDEGAIEFSLNGDHYSNINSPKLTYQPKSGDIVLFPSSLHHRTIPFTTNADRIIVSFDLMPETANPFDKNKSLTLEEKLQKIPEDIQQNKSTNKPSPPQPDLENLNHQYQAGHHGEAEKLAMSLTKKFPQHQSGWKVLGALWAKTGRDSEALNAYQTAASLSPQDIEVHNNMGLILQKLGRLDEAQASYTLAITLKPDYAEAHYNLGVALQELGRLDEAVVNLRQAIALKPDFTVAYFILGNTLKDLGKLNEAQASYTQVITLQPHVPDVHNNMGVTLQKLGRLDEAQASYTLAITLKPDYAEAHNNSGVTLQELGRLDEAEASYRKAIALKYDFEEAHFNLGNMLQEIGRLEEAALDLRQAIALKPNHTEAHNRLLNCLYLLDIQSVFFEELDSLISQNTVNAVIGSLTLRSALKYGLEKPNPFCKDPMAYVVHTDLDTICDFKRIFVETTHTILNEKNIVDRKQSLLLNGYQTSGNLFDIQNSFTKEIQKAIRLEIEKYRINFGTSEEGFIKKWPTEYSLYGWLISMKSGGELKPHIHDQGWLSGSVYINVPSKSKFDSGNLVLSLGDEKDSSDTRLNIKKMINVVTGSLVLFPGSLTHYTIPFEAEEERIVLAFDVKKIGASKNM